MDELRHAAVIEHLDAISSRVRFDWGLFLLTLGGALWCGLATGPAIIAACAGEFIGAIVIRTARQLIRSG